MFISPISIVLFLCRDAIGVLSFRTATHARPNLMCANPTTFLRRLAPTYGLNSRPPTDLSSRRIRLANPSTGRMIVSERPDSVVSPSSEKYDVCVRILCLHGKGGEGKKFVNDSLMPLRSLVEKRLANPSNGEVEFMISFQWECLTAPYELIPNDDNGGYSWWTMPSGVRSYNAQEIHKSNHEMFRRTTVHLNLNEKYEGFEESEAMVMDKIFPNANEIDQACAFDIILGHSQGAILIAALLSLHEKLWKSSGPSGFILNGCAWPNPYSNSLVSMTERQRSGKIDSLPRIIFIMGKEDNINPIDSAMQVHDAYRAAEFDVSIVNHGGGHSVPVGKDKDSERALEEVVDWIVEIAKQKALHLTNYV